MLAFNKLTMTLTALFTQLPLFVVLLVLLILGASPTNAQTSSLLGFACSDKSCNNGIKSFPGTSAQPSFGLPYGTNSWKSVEAGGRVCRGSGGNSCANCDNISEGGKCYSNGPYHTWCPH